MAALRCSVGLALLLQFGGMLVGLGPHPAEAAATELLEASSALGGALSGGLPPGRPLLAPGAAGPAAPEAGKLRGVRYAPHQVGEPSNNVFSLMRDFYQAVYQGQHREHLRLISKSLRANTLVLQPWNNQAGPEVRGPFYEAMQREKLQHLIPAFQVSRHYYAAMREKQDVDQGPDSPLFRDFNSFIGSIIDFSETISAYAADATDRPGFRAWSIDLALKVEDLWGQIPADGEVTDCFAVQPPSMLGDSTSPFQLYKDTLTGLANRVWPNPGVPQFIKEQPLLVPLDLTEVTGQQWKRARGLLKCLTQWLNGTYKGLFEGGRAQWLLAFTLPMPSMGDDIPANTSDCQLVPRCSDFVRNGFITYLDDLTTDFGKAPLKPKINVMLAAHALAYNTRTAYGGIVEDYGAQVDGRHYLARQQVMLRYAFQEYHKREKDHPSLLQGFIVDEWMDNWERLSRSETQ